MNILWWFFWAILIVLFFALLVPVPRSSLRRDRESALDLLRRRYAAGELTTAEYEDKRDRIERDIARANVRERLGPPLTPQAT